MKAPRFVSILLGLFLLAAPLGCAPAGGEAIQASGQIEATEISVAPELGGRVVEVAVHEGDSVKAGDSLLRLDDSLLRSQRRSAQAALDSANAGVRAAQASWDLARAQYDAVLSAALAGDEAARLAAWKQSQPSEFDLPAWYYDSTERLKAAQAEVDSAEKNLADRQARLAEVTRKAGSADFPAVEARLAEARVAYDTAKSALDATGGVSDASRLHDSAQSAFNDAKTDLKDARTAYDDALTTEGAKDLLKARADVAAAQARYDAAIDNLHSLQTGVDAPGVVVARKAADQAEALLAQAQSAVPAAQAVLDLIDAQIEKLILRAPAGGVVLVRSIEPGEVIQAGATAFTIGQLGTLRVTVYIPEDQYGRINLGEPATLSVDSFPGQAFDAVVTRISDQAEFTPQNVQTREGRQTTVYAVELSAENPDGKLKPGMPVDVTFERAASRK